MEGGDHRDPRTADQTAHRQRVPGRRRRRARRQHAAPRAQYHQLDVALRSGQVPLGGGRRQDPPHAGRGGELRDHRGHGPTGRAGAEGRVMSAPPSLSDREALELADAGVDALSDLMAAAAARRDAAFCRRITFSPKVFLPVTNLCRNRCDYCSFRRSPGQLGEWTMSPPEIEDWLERGREAGCVEALFCLGDSPERAFANYRRFLASTGHNSTADYLWWAGRRALARGLIPHTNAGILSAHEMARQI